MYIARKLLAPQAALNLERAFRKEILSLAHMPSRFSTIDEQPWKDAGIRKTQVKNYYIYYLIDEAEKTVKVNAVIYIGRDQAKQLSKRNRLDELNQQ